MIACTSPSPTDRSIPFRISRPSASRRACRFLISSIITSVVPAKAGTHCAFELADAAFEAHREEFLRLDRELHRQFLQDLLAEAVDDQRQGVLVGEAALAAIEQLVL